MSTLHRRVHLPLIIAALLITLISYLHFAATGNLALDAAFPPRPFAEGLGILFAVAVALSLYGYRNAVSPGEEGRLSLEQTVRLAKLLGVISFFSLPILSNDMFIYLSCGEAPLRGINPYLDEAFLQETTYHPFIPAIWADGPYCKYGPAAISLAQFAAFIGGKTPIAGIFAWKVLSLAAFLLFCDAAALLLRRFGTEHGAAAPFILLCPILWVQGPGQGHNDLFAALFLTAALLALAYHRFLFALLLLALALQVKFYILPLIALFLIVWWRSVPHTRKEAVLFATAMLGAAALTALLHYPYWRGWDTLKAIYGPLFWEEPMNNAAYLIPYGIVAIVPSAESVRPLLENMIRAVLIALVGFASLWQAYRLLYRGDRAYLVFLRIMTLVICFTALRFHAWYLIAILPLFAEGVPATWLRWGLVVFPLTLFFDIHNFLPRDAVTLVLLLPAAVVFVNLLFFSRLRERLTHSA